MGVNNIVSHLNRNRIFTRDDQAKADADRARVMLENAGTKAITPQMVRTFAETARRHIRLEGGG